MAGWIFTKSSSKDVFAVLYSLIRENESPQIFGAQNVNVHFLVRKFRLRPLRTAAVQTGVLCYNKEI